MQYFWRPLLQDRGHLTVNSWLLEARTVVLQTLLTHSMEKTHIYKVKLHFPLLFSFFYNIFESSKQNKVLYSSQVTQLFFAMKQYQKDCPPLSAPFSTTTNQSMFTNTCSLHACKTSKLLITLPQKPHNTNFGEKKKTKTNPTLNNSGGKGVLLKIILLKSHLILYPNAIYY